MISSREFLIYSQAKLPENEPAEVIVLFHFRTQIGTGNIIPFLK